ncbi:hypothetical protein ACFL26_01660 [Patescibacteria group bacterium]
MNGLVLMACCGLGVAALMPVGLVALVGSRRRSDTVEPPPPPLRMSEYPPTHETNMRNLADRLLSALTTYRFVLLGRTDGLSDKVKEASEKMDTWLAELSKHSATRLETNPVDGMYHAIRAVLRAVCWHIYVNLDERGVAGEPLGQALLQEINQLQSEDENSVSCAWLFGYRGLRSEENRQLAREVAELLQEVEQELDSMAFTGFNIHGLGHEVELRDLAKLRTSLQKLQDKAYALRLSI